MVMFLDDAKVFFVKPFGVNHKSGFKNMETSSSFLPIVFVLVITHNGTPFL